MNHTGENEMASGARRVVAGLCSWTVEPSDSAEGAPKIGRAP